MGKNSLKLRKITPVVQDMMALNHHVMFHENQIRNEAEDRDKRLNTQNYAKFHENLSSRTNMWATWVKW